MRSLLVTVLIAGGVLLYYSATAAAGCGPGCHMTLYGACVVDGWGTVRNECPVPSQPRPPCPIGLQWRHGGCMPAN
jgi:hypothetical protein